MSLLPQCELGWSYGFLWALAIFQAVLIVALLRQLGDIRRLAERAGGLSKQLLPTGAPAPAVEGVEMLTGQRVSTRMLEGRAAIILFLSSDCRSCAALAASLAVADVLPNVVAICHGDEQSCKDLGHDLCHRIRFLLDRNGHAASRYGVGMYPTAVALDERHTIRLYGFPKNTEELKALMVNAEHGLPIEFTPTVSQA